MTIHPKAKRWVEEVEFLGFPIVVSVPLALGSWWGLGAFLLLLVVVIWRLMDEERYLSDHLAGYKDYCANVTHRLIPALW